MMQDTTQHLKVALMQMTPTRDVQVNLSQVLDLIKKAADQNAELIVVPENALCIGSNQVMREAAIRLDGPEVQALGDAAREAQAVVVLGGAKCRGADEIVRNSALVFSPSGNLVAVYDKVHLFNANVGGVVFNASSVEAAGDSMLVVEVKGVKVGVTICYDVRFPELFRQLALAGAEVILVPAAFTYKTGEAHWEVLMRARAIESSAYVIASATIRGAHSSVDGFETYGHALAVDPWGRILDDLGDAPQCVRVLTLDMAQVKSVRSSLPVLDGIRPEVYASSPKLIAIEEAEHAG
jgi:predicted amidohydrolase